VVLVNQFTVNVEEIKPFNTATPTTLNSRECTTDTGRHEYKVKWVGYTNHHNSWVM